LPPCRLPSVDCFCDRCKYDVLLTVSELEHVRRAERIDYEAKKTLNPST
jgi:hypothetical protein